MKAVRVLVYEGTVEWVKATLAANAVRPVVYIGDCSIKEVVLMTCEEPYIREGVGDAKHKVVGEGGVVVSVARDGAEE